MSNHLKYVMMLAASQLMFCSLPAVSSDWDDDDDPLPIKATETQARRTLDTFASCIVDKDSVAARQIAMMQPLDPMLDELANKIVDVKCLNVRDQSMRLRLQAMSMRYALAEALIKKEMIGFHPPSFKAISTLDHGNAPQIDKASLPQEADKKRTAVITFERHFQNWLADNLGECAVRLSPSDARSLLETRIGSEAEQEALLTTDRHFAKCLPEGMDLKMDKFDVRGTVAVNYYRLALAAGTAPLQKAETR